MLKEGEDLVEEHPNGEGWVNGSDSQFSRSAVNKVMIANMSNGYGMSKRSSTKGNIILLASHRGISNK